MKITNVSKSKLVFAAGFALNAGQSRDATDDDLKSFNPVLLELWKKNGLIEVEVEAKAKVVTEAKAKVGNGGGKQGGGKLPG